MKHLGDYDTGGIIYGKFTTYDPATGQPATLGTGASLAVYKNADTGESVAGVTLAVDFDGKTGLHHFTIDTSADGAFYAAGSFFDIVLASGSVGGVSVAHSEIASFTLRRDSALKPTTAARTLDVSAGGEAGVDWANVGSPTTAVNLSGTTVGTATALGADAVSAAALAAGAVAEIQTGLATSAQAAAIKAKTDGLVFTVGGQVDANVQYVNNVQVTGDGQPGTEWGPA